MSELERRLGTRLRGLDGDVRSHGRASWPARPDHQDWNVARMPAQIVDCRQL
jgi:hypothetical protein